MGKSPRFNQYPAPYLPSRSMTTWVIAQRRGTLMTCFSQHCPDFHIKTLNSSSIVVFTLQSYPKLFLVRRAFAAFLKTRPTDFEFGLLLQNSK